MNGNTDKSSEIHIAEIIVKSGDCEKLLGVKIGDRVKITENCKH